MRGIGLGLIVVPLLLAGCRSGPEQWGPFGGRVVDAETGEPLAGAHVMVSWERDHPNPDHWTQRFYDAEETVTDGSGRFEIPRKTRIVTVLVSEPRFGVFYAGYVAATEEVTPAGGRVFVDPTIVRMRRLETHAERCTYSPAGPGVAAGAKAPQFAAAVQKYAIELNCRWPEGR